ncbi:MAG TPA: class I SAM-dependent methyltransferase, partial [Acetobacteraceae bacterium]|nr:class I SAM-dependent methyltransferase [Acetobacteraceae bacterium]
MNVVAPRVLRASDALMEIPRCRCCEGSALKPVFDLGSMPASDGFTASADEPDPAWPLEVVVCEDCGLAQLRHTVSPEVLFSPNYRYFSSFTQTVVDNARENVEQAIARFCPAPGSLVVELASNDGYLLKHAMAQGLRVLGIDPSPLPVEAARAAGVDTMLAFFTDELARELAAGGLKATLLFGSNVLAHVADTRGFVRGIRRILAQDGTAIIEVPYLRDLVQHVEFDTIYHEHLCYFSLTALSSLFEREGLSLNDAERIAIHGGSVRLFVQHHAAPSERLLRLMREERETGLDGPAAFLALSERVAQVGRDLRKLLDSLKAEGAR